MFFRDLFRTDGTAGLLPPHLLAKMRGWRNLTNDWTAGYAELGIWYGVHRPRRFDQSPVHLRGDFYSPSVCKEAMRDVTLRCAGAQVRARAVSVWRI
jgi:hypothetical protein